MTVEAVKEFGLSRKDAGRAKNMFALGLLSWMYGRPTETTIAFLEKRFAKVPDIRDANITAYRAGWNFGETTETFVVKYEIKPAPMKVGTYRNITGNLALSYGLVASGVRSGLPVFLGSYPITPASDILHELSKHKSFGVTTFQAEDEIAGIGAALGAAFAGALGVTTTSGPGLALKSETIGLAVMTELPLLVIDVQRGGPSTGLPTKTEQADLLQAMFGRNGESPVPIVAPQSPGDCFDAALEAARIAVTYRTPVMLLSDGMLANGSEPWRIPELDELPTIDPGFATARNQGSGDEAGVLAVPPRRGDPGPAVGHPRHGRSRAPHRRPREGRRQRQHLLRPRQPRLHGPHPPGQGGPDRGEPAAPRGRRPVRQDGQGAKVLVLGWGSTYGPIGAGCRRVRHAGYHVAQVHLRHLNPLPRDLGEILKRYDRVLIPEMNLGQLSLLVRARYLVDAVGYHQVNGMPLKAAALAHAIADLVAEAEGIEAPLGVWGETVVKEHATVSTIDLPVPGMRSGIDLVPTADGAQTAKEFTSDQEVRWCPGCGDYAVLKAVQGFLPDLGLRRENIVFVSGIGCSSRFPYYLDTYGMHSIHGRAPAIATGIATSRSDLSVWVVTGDGDALSIGGNHLIHALRRNINMTILLFNNRIYGLTKGQYSPTSEAGKVTKSTPMGSLDHPFNPVSLALGAEATFVARTIDSDRKHLTSVLSAAAAHRGTSLVEIYQNCPIFNDGAFDAIKDRDPSAASIIPLVDGQPIRFGPEAAKGLIRDNVTGGVKVVEVADVGEDAILVHDSRADDPTTAFAISRLTDAGYLYRAPIGIFRQVERPTYDDLARDQIDTARAAVPRRDRGPADGADQRIGHLDRRLTSDPLVAGRSRQRAVSSDRGDAARSSQRRVRRDALRADRLKQRGAQRKGPHPGGGPSDATSGLIRGVGTATRRRSARPGSRTCRNHRPWGPRPSSTSSRSWVRRCGCASGPSRLCGSS